MREILFRGKRVCDGKWCLGVPYTIKDEATFIINNCRTLDFTNKDTDFQGCKVIPETVGQYTGLKDKNGNKIFEGDYIFVPYNLIGKQEVKYLEEKGRYNISNYALDNELIYLL